jgi:cob(I)alamin adenosyltransferase
LNPENNKQRFIQVYTGAGKGKTTAALGMALRACGHGKCVKMICFMKGDPNYGEMKMSAKIPGFEIIQSGLSTFVKKGEPSDDDLKLAKKGMHLARELFQDKDLDLLILDEINVAVDFGLIPLSDVLELLETKPSWLELVLTGRFAHPDLVKRADLVSEILEIKHPYEDGVQAREGFDF